MAGLSDWMIGIVLFGMIMTGGFFIVASLGMEYGIPMSSEMNSTFNQMNVIKEDVDTMQTSLNPSDPGELGLSQTGSPWSFLATGGWAILNLFKDMPLMVINIISLIGTTYGIPAWFILGLTLIVSIIIFTSIANVIFRSGQL